MSDATTSPAPEQLLPTGATSPMSTVIRAAMQAREQMLAAIKAAYAVSSSVTHTTRLVAEATTVQEQMRAAVAPLVERSIGELLPVT